MSKLQAGVACNSRTGVASSAPVRGLRVPHQFLERAPNPRRGIGALRISHGGVRNVSIQAPAAETVGEAAGANPNGRKSVLPLLPDAHYESIGLSRLSNAICVGDDFHVTHWHITPGDLFNVVDSVEACGVSGHVAMPLRTVRSSENQIQIVLQAGAGWVSPHQCRLDCLVRRSNRHRSRFLLTRVELFAVSLIPELHLTARRHNLPDVYTSKTLTIVRDTADLRRSILSRDSVGGVYDQGFEQSCTRIILAMGSRQIFAYDCDAACNQWSGHARAAIEEIERI